jgi:hypothetical protein
MPASLTLIIPRFDERACPRWQGGRRIRLALLFFWHQVGNGLFTLLSNMTANLNISDIWMRSKNRRRET